MVCGIGLREQLHARASPRGDLHRLREGGACPLGDGGAQRCPHRVGVGGRAAPTAPVYAETPPCLKEDRGNLVAGLKPAIAVDYVALMRGGGRRSTPSPLMEAGRKCATAKDQRDCELKLSGLPPPERGMNIACVPSYCDHFLIATSGDDVIVVDTIDEVKNFLGTIDTPNEAVLMAWANEYHPGDAFLGTCELAKGQGIKQSKAGYVFDASKTLSLCPIKTEKMVLQVSPAGAVKVVQSKGVTKTTACAGRRTEGHSSREPARSGSYLTTMMALEHESIFAFERLATELTAHQAPCHLVRAARRAAEDERRHTRMMRRQAAKRTSSSGPPKDVAPRSLSELAMENEVEGCVRETYGALVATWQAERAPSETLRRVFSRIAKDETRHATLAHEISSWARSKLSRRDNVRLDAARERAFAELKEQVSEPIAEAASLGLPTPENARALLSAMRRGIG